MPAVVIIATVDAPMAIFRMAAMMKGMSTPMPVLVICGHPGHHLCRRLLRRDPEVPAHRRLRGHGNAQAHQDGQAQIRLQSAGHGNGAGGGGHQAVGGVQAATSIGIVILCGTIIGTILEKTGAALTMANTILKLVGKKNSVVAMGAMGYVTGIPVFCDSGFVVLSPI